MEGTPIKAFRRGLLLISIVIFSAIIADLSEGYFGFAGFLNALRSEQS